MYQIQHFLSNDIDSVPPPPPPPTPHYTHILLGGGGHFSLWGQTDTVQATSLREFKNKIKGCRPVECPCNLCKTYIAGVGFIDVK